MISCLWVAPLWFVGRLKAAFNSLLLIPERKQLLKTNLSHIFTVSVLLFQHFSLSTVGRQACCVMSGAPTDGRVKNTSFSLCIVRIYCNWPVCIRRFDFYLPHSVADYYGGDLIYVLHLRTSLSSYYLSST